MYLSSKFVLLTLVLRLDGVFCSGGVRSCRCYGAPLDCVVVVWFSGLVLVVFGLVRPWYIRNAVSAELFLLVDLLLGRSVTRGLIALLEAGLSR